MTDVPLRPSRDIPRLRRQMLDAEDEEAEEGEDEEIAQAKSLSSAGLPDRVSRDVAMQIDTLRAHGEPLPEEARAFFEPRLGYDFNTVRVHRDAAGPAAALDAAAFTVGQHIFFGAGQFDTHSVRGRTLLAHELVHTIQQGHAPTRVERQQATTAHVVQRTGGRPNLQLKALDYSSAPDPPKYDEVVTALRELYGRKAALRDAPRVAAEQVNEIDKQIAARLQDLALLGVRVDPDRVFKAVMLPTGGDDLKKVNGRIERTPPGAIRPGRNVTFTLVVDWLPPEELPDIEWKWRTPSGEDGYFFDPRGLLFGGYRGKDFEKRLDDVFWTGPIAMTTRYGYPAVWKKEGKFQTVAVVHLGGGRGKKDVVGEWAAFEEDGARVFDIESAPQAIVGAPVNVHVKGWSPEPGRAFIDWEVDREARYRDNMEGSADVTFLTEGTHIVHGTLRDTDAVRNAMRRGVRRDDPALPSMGTASTTIKVLKPADAAGQLLDAAKQAPQPLADLAASFQQSMAGIGTRAKLGGTTQKYWEDRLEAQQERVEGLRRLVPGFESSISLPADPSTLVADRVYSLPIPALLVYPSEGASAFQRLSLYLTVRKSGPTWHAQLIDLTSRKVLEFAKDATTPAVAVSAALARWQNENPYPTGGTAAARFDAFGVHHDVSFETTTLWKDAKEWVDGTLRVGAIVGGVLLLAAPEATVTKVLGYALLALSIARSSVAIAENVMLGREWLDESNVLEAAVIVTSAVGVTGGFLRAAGASATAVRPVMFRIGNWMILTAVAGDVGTFVYATSQALEAIRVATSDPTLADDQKQAALMRVMASLLLNGLLLIVSNREMLKRMSLSDFGRRALPERIPPGTKLEIGEGTRLDIELELRRAGRSPAEVRNMTKDQLVEAYGKELTKRAYERKKQEARDQQSAKDLERKKQQEAARAKSQQENVAAEKAEREALTRSQADPNRNTAKDMVIGEEALRKHFGHSGEQNSPMPEHGYWLKDGTFVTKEVKRQAQPAMGSAVAKFEQVAKYANEPTPAGQPKEPKLKFLVEIPDWWAGKFDDLGYSIGPDRTLYYQGKQVRIAGEPVNIRVEPLKK